MSHVWRLLQLSLLLPAIAFGSGCATSATARSSDYQYFAAPSQTDPWSPKIAGWQRREQRSAEPEAVALRQQVLSPVATGQGSLRSKYRRFKAVQQAAVAERDEKASGLARWIQQQARRHYVPDGPIDHWATLEDTLVKNGDDCDGLELLVYNALRDLGFGEDQVYRAIVYRPDDGQHHMVTLWFDRSDDPYVIDPTGAMTHGMPRMSQVAGWVPLKVFSETDEFSVRSVVSYASR
ncbi:MAG: hypothetical protein CL910_15680 [Deltaproteobacteria bacterium]|jgi:hypothetical protein|nr:hypothetical protein [Deltaproteobacteria bacterium]